MNSIQKEIPDIIVSKWQNLLNLIIKLYNVPVALIMRVKKPIIEVFTKSTNIENPYNPGNTHDLNGLYCEQVISTESVLEVNNALKSEKWKENPDIELGLIYYYGLPVRWPNGKVFGTICILDKEERRLKREKRHLFDQFRDLIEDYLEIISVNKKYRETIDVLNTYKNKLASSKNKYRNAYKKLDFYKDLLIHDVNNYLQNIQSYTELIQMNIKKSDNANPQNQEFLYTIKEQVLKSSNLISNVRAISKLESELITDLNKINLCDFLTKSIDYIKKTYSHRNITFKIHSYSKKIQIKANKFIEIIFNNIFLNAMKYNDEESIKIWIRISKKPKFIKIEIMDNGRGIKPDKKEEIFQEGYKLFRKGMGIGLSIVKELVNIYNGKIFVENRIKNDYSKGASFVILLSKP